MKVVVITDLYHKQIEPITVVITFLTQESQEVVRLKIAFIILKEFRGEDGKQNEQRIKAVSVLWRNEH